MLPYVCTAVLATCNVCILHYILQVYTFLFVVKTSNFVLIPSRVIYLGEVSVDWQSRLRFVSATLILNTVTMYTMPGRRRLVAALRTATSSSIHCLNTTS